MADEDEIDILGDFSFNSCLAQNSQGIPSCSDREDTVHPQWLLDSPATNWYDTQNIDKNRTKHGPFRKLSGNNTTIKHDTEQHTIWSQEEKDLLKNEMIKYGRNVHKISQVLKTKSEAEIQALIEAEHGILLETPSMELEKHGDEDILVVQEEIVTDDLVNMNDVLSMVTTGAPTIPVSKKRIKKKITNMSTKNRPIKTKVHIHPSIIDSTELYYEDDLMIGSTESVGLEANVNEVPSKSTFKQQKEKVKTMKKIGNHRRKVSRNHDKGRTRNKSKDNLKSPQRRQKKDSSMSNDIVKSPQMQIVLGSGLALPVSEGEQIIKIEKKNSDCESDIEIDIDSDTEGSPTKVEKKEKEHDEAPVAVPLRKFEPMPKRNRKINLGGGGGYTIMHTESGDLYEIGQEPRKERPQKKPVIDLFPCRFYSADKPAPCEVSLHVSALCLMDAHAHASTGEVMGLVGGRWAAPRLRLRLYRRARAARQSRTHCDMEPASQAAAAAWLRARAAPPAAWHHSHPRFPAAPSATDLRTQRALQAQLAWPLPFLALVTSQHWPRGRSASTLRCFRVEDYDEATDMPIGYQFSVKIIPDFTRESIPEFLEELRDLWCNFVDRDHLSVNLPVDVCPQAGMTYLEKCISSMRHHMHSAGYEDNDPLIEQLIQGVRDIFR
ncbi:uncharacterized protein LOC123656820 [Melitaea cinxia]|uniref:uncharacterized protein LOC123656820 n=1 Tax=Melitaea cinxia TaxID=113334 RepID=UPI001E270818|nr:uncharacterized protein LOC123656820 [Melitaea cinxia]